MSGETNRPPSVQGRVKWFDPAKGYGFVVPDQGGPEILLHANVLRNYGRTSVADDSSIVVEVERTERGFQAVAVLSIQAPTTSGRPLEELDEVDPAVLAQRPLEPARVRWFDRGKDYGFANAWGSLVDVLVLGEVLRRSGFAALETGEAIGMRTFDGERGLIAVEIAAWENPVRLPRPSVPHQSRSPSPTPGGATLEPDSRPLGNRGDE